MRPKVTLEQFVANVEGVRSLGQGFSAKCPHHDDQKQSLSIDTGRDGDLLLFCHAGCSSKKSFRLRISVGAPRSSHASTRE